jgi:hypothetical protein
MSALAQAQAQVQASAPVATVTMKPVMTKGLSFRVNNSAVEALTPDERKVYKSVLEQIKSCTGDKKADFAMIAKPVLRSFGLSKKTSDDKKQSIKKLFTMLVPQVPNVSEDEKLTMMLSGNTLIDVVSAAVKGDITISKNAAKVKKHDANVDLLKLETGLVGDLQAFITGNAPLQVLLAGSPDKFAEGFTLLAIRGFVLASRLKTVRTNQLQVLVCALLKLIGLLLASKGIHENSAVIGHGITQSVMPLAHDLICDALETGFKVGESAPAAAPAADASAPAAAPAADASAPAAAPAASAAKASKDDEKAAKKAAKEAEASAAKKAKEDAEAAKAAEKAAAKKAKEDAEAAAKAAKEAEKAAAKAAKETAAASAKPSGWKFWKKGDAASAASAPAASAGAASAPAASVTTTTAQAL